MPDFELESSFDGLVAGVDEAGCGPWAGPVVAGAVLFNTYDLPEELTKILNDSKKLSIKKREHIFALLNELDGDLCHIGVGQASVAEVDKINIRQAAILAMKRAVESLLIFPNLVLADGIVRPNLNCEIKTVKQGDSKSFSIAAGSVVAKVTRDKIMHRLANEFPQYAWESNSGYGTKSHQEALAIHGVTPHHRKSFAPIAKLLEVKNKIKDAA